MLKTKDKFNEYLHKLQKGDKSAIIFFYNNYYDKMVTIGKKFVIQQTAEDIASNFLLKLLANPQNYNDVDEPARWIYTSVKNAALNSISQSQKVVVTDSLDQYFETAREFAATVDARVSNKMELEKVLSRLDETDHEIVVYHFMFGYSYAEISKILNIPVGTIKRRVHNQRKK